MPLYDFECPACDRVFERIAAVDEIVHCPDCDFECRRIISASGVNCANQDAEWIRSVREVVDKEGGPAAQRFLKDPTRTNYKSWMKEAGVRHFEEGEPIKPPPIDERRLVEEAVKRFREREEIEL